MEKRMGSRGLEDETYASPSSYAHLETCRQRPRWTQVAGLSMLAHVHYAAGRLAHEMVELEESVRIQ